MIRRLLAIVLGVAAACSGVTAAYAEPSPDLVTRGAEIKARPQIPWLLLAQRNPQLLAMLMAVTNPSTPTVSCPDSGGNHLNFSSGAWACGTSTPTLTHSLLSATHTDTTAAAVVRGDLITGQTASPTWKRLAIGGNNTFLGSNGTDAAWTSLTLASAQFANQGTTTTVLHGNAAGNPSFGSVVEGDFSFTNVTTANVSTSAHGLTPILPNDATKYLDGTGAFSVPAGGANTALSNLASVAINTTLLPGAVDNVDLGSTSFPFKRYFFGESSTLYGSLGWNKSQTNHLTTLATDSTNRSVLLIDKANVAFDYAHGNQANPTFFVHSVNQNTTQWMSFTHDGTNGIINVGTGVVVIASIQAPISPFQFGQGGLQFEVSNSWPGLNATNSGYGYGIGGDTFLFRRAAATWIVGKSDAASPVAQKITAQGATGSNAAGAATFTFEPSASTGTANAGDFVINRVPTTQGSGSTQNTGVEALRVVSRQFALTSGAAATFATVTGLGAHKRTGGEVIFTIEAADGTNDQSVSCSARFAAVDTTAGAGGETCAFTLDQTTCSCAAGFGACSTGTLAVTVAATTGTDLCNLRVTSTTSLTATTHKMSYRVGLNGTLGAISPQ